MRSFTWSTVSTQVGELHVATSKLGVCRVALPNERRGEFLSWLDRHAEGGALIEDHKAHEELGGQLRKYFNRDLTRFTVPIDLIGTEFQVQVWKELVSIPYGTTITYGELAKRVGRPQGAQSVGGANGANPVPIIVPCHRVVGSDESMTGYGGGIAMKEFLLRLEGALLV